MKFAIFATKHTIMADNFIEKQYEQYQSRKAAMEMTGRHTARKQTAHTAGCLQGKRAFVTGGAKGIGKAIVTALRAEGCMTAFCDTDSTAGMKTAHDTGAAFFHTDVSDTAALESCMQQLFARWGDIDIIVNNAGVSRFSPITETTPEEFDNILSINLKPAFVTSHQMALHRSKADEPSHYGRIINICSTRYLMSEPGSEGYAASKGGIYSLTHALALSLAEWHVTVNSIAPGWIQNEDYDQLRPEDHEQHPSHRVGKPEDIARICIFLCQEDNDFINGENIVADGGMTKKMIYIE